MLERQQWKVVKRPLLEIVLKRYVQQHQVTQPLLLHGPRGVGKRTLIQGLVNKWRRAPYALAHLDLNHGQFTTRDGITLPSWTLSENAKNDEQSVSLEYIRTQLETELETLTKKAVQLGCIGGFDVFQALKHRYAIEGALSQFLLRDAKVGENKVCKLRNMNESWQEALRHLSECDVLTGWPIKTSLVTQNWNAEYTSRTQEACAWFTALQDDGYDSENAKPLSFRQNPDDLKVYKESLLSLVLAKSLFYTQEKWKRPAGEALRMKGSISKSLADSTTSWVFFLIFLLSKTSVEKYFQPILVINNFDVLRKVVGDSLSVDGLLYHDSLVLRLLKFSLSEGCMPTILVTSDSYYSWEIYEDLGIPNLFVSREDFGWTPEEASVHLVPKVFDAEEFKVVTKILGSNPRHLFELHSVQQNLAADSFPAAEKADIEDALNIYLGYLQVSVVDPAMESAIKLLENFAKDAWECRILKPEQIFRHGAPWRYPPRPSQHDKCHHWARIQLTDFIEAMTKGDFSANYLGPSGVEITEDPALTALLEVGLFYRQRNPSYIRPTTRGIMRCLVRWLAMEKIKWSSIDRLQYFWHRLARGRCYRHIIIPSGF